MADESLPPLEIPWKLASTTQPLTASEPAPTAISMFYFEPVDATLNSQFPDDRLVFIKLTTSISPAAFPAELSKVAASFLGEGIPCMHLLLDLKVRPATGSDPSIRPYFHTAAPLTRRMVQSGVVGAESYEGEADGLAVGKSGSQISETLRSHSNTSSSSASASYTTFLPIPIVPGLLSVGGSVRNSSTDVASDRAVSQSVDSTSRDASEERRELVSHTTRVENIISLLSAKYVGTPYLSFSVSPQPLQQLSVDASDPNLWFQQLMARRSSGIEGIQEFTAVVVVPKGTNFCVNARMRRVCLLDSPPGPLTLEERFTGSLSQLARMVNYLNRTFPPGTPLEELDIDIIGALTGGTFRRPVVELWGLRPGEQLVVALVASPGSAANLSQHGTANYKHFLEVWLDTLRDEYEREISRSPLERGVLFGENRFLDTCFSRDADGGTLGVAGSTSNVTPLFRLPLHTGLFDIGGVKTTATSGNASARTRALETTTRWNAIERQLNTLLSNGKALGEIPLAASDPRVLGVLTDVWRKLAPDDPRNVPLDEAAALLKLNASQKALLKKAGVSNLSGIAATLAVAADIELHNAEVDRIGALYTKRKIQDVPPDAIKGAVTAEDSSTLLGSIAAGLSGK